MPDELQMDDLTMERVWTVYLSGEIHTDWRAEIAAGVAELDLPIELTAPATIHEDSDDCAAAILGEPENGFFRDQIGSRMNAMRTRALIEEADIVVVRFGDKYKQWNAAFDAGYAAALGKSIITQHDPALTHPLKEVDGAAMATCQTVDQIVKTLAYVTTGKLIRS